MKENGKKERKKKRSMCVCLYAFMPPTSQHYAKLRLPNNHPNELVKSSKSVDVVIALPNSHLHFKSRALSRSINL